MKFVQTFESGILLLSPNQYIKYQCFLRYLANKSSISFLKWHNSRKGHNSDKKKTWVSYFFHKESIYEISRPQHAWLKS